MSTEVSLDALPGELQDRFAGTAPPDVVGRYVNDSYVARHRTTCADPQLPELGRRFATDRLTNPASPLTSRSTHE